MRRGSPRQEAEHRLTSGVTALSARVEPLTKAILSTIRREQPDVTMLEEPGLAEVIQFETTALIGQILNSLLSPNPMLEPSESRHVARLAARYETPLNALNSCYRIGHRILEEALIDAIAVSPTGHEGLADAIRLGCSRLFLRMDALQKLLQAEYGEELDGIRRSISHADLRTVQAILDGREPDSPFSYELDRQHLAVAMSGEGSARALGVLLADHRGPLLIVEPDDHLAWAWLSGGEAAWLEAEASGELDHSLHLGIGEPAIDVVGFRQSHNEARMALRVAERTRQGIRRFSNVATEAIALADEEAARALVIRQLGDLAVDSERAERLRSTIQTYLSCEQNARSAAALMGVTDRTISLRLRQAEDLLPKTSSPVGLETALALRLLPMLLHR